MRTRNLKPGFFKNDVLGSLDPLCRILFSGLWCVADRAGRLEDRPLRIKAELLPFDECNVDELLNTLSENEFIIRYEANGKRFIQIINFARHQHPHMKEAESEIPPCEAEKATSDSPIFFAQDEHGANPSLNLNPQTLNLNPQTSNLKPQSGADTGEEKTGDEETREKREATKTSDEADGEAEAVLTNLEKKASCRYRDRGAALSAIKLKLKAGFTQSELISVTDKLYAEWHGTGYEHLFTPSHIFGNKFEEYLLRKPIPPKRTAAFTGYSTVRPHSYDELSLFCNTFGAKEKSEVRG